MLQQVPVCQTSFKSSKFLRRILKKVMAKGRIKIPNEYGRQSEVRIGQNVLHL